MSKVLAQVTAKHFCAGIILDRANVYQTAPILRYMMGWTARKVKEYCDSKGWLVASV